MSNANNSTENPTLSKPEIFTAWLFQTLGNLRGLLGLLVIVGLTLVSATFNYQLGVITASDPVSQALLPIGFALLDGACLFLAGYIGLKAQGALKKTIGWLWFLYLLALSLWACTSFNVALDAKAQAQRHGVAIQAIEQDLVATQAQIQTWQEKLAGTERFSTRYQGTLDRLNARRDQLLSELHHLQAKTPLPALAIYHKLASILPGNLQPDELASVVRLLWSVGLVGTPLLLTLLLSGHVQAPLPGRPKRKTASPESTDKPVPGTPETVPNMPGGKNVYPFPSTTNTAKKPLPGTLGSGSGDSTKTVTGNGSRLARGTVAEQVQEREPKPEQGPNLRFWERYEKCRRLIESGQVRPSCRSIQRAARLQNAQAVAYLRRMVEEGVLVRAGQGYRMA